MNNNCGKPGNSDIFVNACGKESNQMPILKKRNRKKRHNGYIRCK